MGMQGAFGAKVKINVTSTLTVIAHLLDMDDVTMTKVIADMTGHDATDGWGEKVDAGRRDMSSFKITLGWDDADTTHAALVAAFNGKAAVPMSVEDPSGAEVITFNAFISSISRQYKAKDGYKAVVTIDPTGKPTIA